MRNEVKQKGEVMKRTTSVSMTQKQLGQLKEFCEKSGLSQSRVMEIALSQFLRVDHTHHIELAIGKYFSEL